MIFLATILGAAVFCAPASDGGSSRYYPVSGSIVMDATLCKSLRNAPRIDANTFIAIYILAHEEGHAHDPYGRNRTDCNRRGACEGYAECWAIRHLRLVARAAGYGQRVILRVRREVRAFVAPPAISNYGPIPAACWR